jgi:hypothetical protein
MTKGLLNGRGVAHQDTFCDFKPQTAWSKAGFLQHVFNLLHQIRLKKLFAGEIDAHR